LVKKYFVGGNTSERTAKEENESGGVGRRSVGCGWKDGRARERKWPDCSWLVLGGRGFCFEVEFGSRDCFIGCLHDVAKSKRTSRATNTNPELAVSTCKQVRVKGQ
jgi:hypothetical protein